MLVLPVTRSTSASRRPAKAAAALSGVSPCLSSACERGRVRIPHCCTQRAAGASAGPAAAARTVAVRCAHAARARTQRQNSAGSRARGAGAPRGAPRRRRPWTPGRARRAGWLLRRRQTAATGPALATPCVLGAGHFFFFFFLGPEPILLTSTPTFPPRLQRRAVCARSPGTCHGCNPPSANASPPPGRSLPETRPSLSALHRASPRPPRAAIVHASCFSKSRSRTCRPLPRGGCCERCSRWGTCLSLMSSLACPRSTSSRTAAVLPALQALSQALPCQARCKRQVWCGAVGTALPPPVCMGRTSRMCGGAPHLCRGVAPRSSRASTAAPFCSSKLIMLGRPLLACTACMLSGARLGTGSVCCEFSFAASGF